MFNRGNIPNPFSSSGQPPPQGYSSPNQAPPRYDSEPLPLFGAALAAPIRDDDVSMTDTPDDQRGYGGPPPQQMPSRMPAGHKGAGPTWTLQPRKSPNEYYTFGNL
jgi:vesicle-fusing ATPase